MNHANLPFTPPKRLPLWRMMTADEQSKTLRAMTNMGGGFARRLAEAWNVADRTNSDRLGDAFDDLVQQFGPGSPNYGA